MPRRKIEIGLIGNAGNRAKTFRQRKRGLVKKAKDLSELCDVDIAVICAGPGGGAPDVWTSSPGVIDRYRALPADKRAKHTHLNYVNGELRKQRTKLAKVREDGPKALALPKEAVLKDMGLEELLGSIDAALLATAERRKALGAPGADVADDAQLGQVAPDAIVPLGQGAPFVGNDSDDMETWINELMWDGVVEPQPLDAIMMQPAPGVQYINGDVVEIGSNQYQAQMPPGSGENDHVQPAWDADQLQNTIPYNPDYGFKCADNNYYLGMDGCSRMQVPSNGNAYEHDGWLRTAMFGADETSCHAVVPVRHPSLGISGDSVYTPSDHFTMDISNNFTAAPAVGLDDSYMYETHCLADYFQNPYSNHNFGVEPLHYLSDVYDGTRYDLEVGSYSAGRTELFPQQSQQPWGTRV
ncbi:hypothetical protein BS78_03G378200 [Paspalum vaginatum]|nr:hypothetical protein BS78_03G378200 [Paspalum vaginatum]